MRTPADNTYAGWPAMRGLGRYYEIDVTCRGQADAVTGYFINITQIDAAVRSEVLPYLQGIINASQAADPPMGELLRTMVRRLQPQLQHSVAAVRLRLTPTYELCLESDAMHQIELSQSYEFSAAHRLHVEQLPASENQRIFGKCNNPAGHGHNYHITVVVRAPIDAQGHSLRVADLDRVVDQTLIKRWDHKNLNVDVPEFGDVNSSVENISRLAFEHLAPAVRSLGEGVTLASVSVHETGKTVCTYRGE